MECTNEECLQDIEVSLDTLDCESNGSSGNHTTSYTYTGIVTCDNCGTEHDVTVYTDEVNDTGDILEMDIQ